MIGGEYPGESMFGGFPTMSGAPPPPPPPTGLPPLSMPSVLTVIGPKGEYTRLTLIEYDTTLRIIQ